MINRLILRQWKAYSHVDIRFEPGTTFLIANNGVGKTSIVQALHFAIFGGEQLIGPSASPIRNAIRGVAEEATVECELVLGGHSVAIERVVRRKGSRGSIKQSVTVDREEINARQWQELITETTRMDPIQLSNLAVVAEGAVLRTRDAGVDIASTLAAIFGVDRLEAAASELERIAARIGRETDERRKSLRVPPDPRVSERRAEIESHIESIKASLATLREQADRLRRAEESRRAWKDFRDAEAARHEALAAWNAQLAAIRGRLVDAGGPLPDTGALGSSEIEAVVTALRDEVISDNARLQAEASTAQRALADLEAGTAICPTCLRPLSSLEATNAREHHQASVSRVSSALESVSTRLSFFADVRRDLLMLQQAQLPVRPVSPDVSEVAAAPDDERQLDDIQGQIQAAEDARAIAQAELVFLERQQQERAADVSLRRVLESGYHRSERAAIAARTMKVLAEHICAERIAPLTAEVEKRWPELWKGESLSMAGSGSLALSSAGAAVPFSEFSGGQRTIAQVLVRLLTLQMATTCPFLVLDEPLEHLDSTHRRSLATLLVKATQRDTPLRQVLVTTYEETVTRRLSSRPLSAAFAEAAHVQYVRTPTRPR